MLYLFKVFWDGRLVNYEDGLKDKDIPFYETREKTFMERDIVCVSNGKERFVHEGDEHILQNH